MMNVYMYPKEIDFTLDDDIQKKKMSVWINCQTTLSEPNNFIGSLS